MTNASAAIPESRAGSNLRKRWAGIALGALAVLLTCALAAPPGLTRAGWRTLGIAACLLCLWISGSFPIGIASLFAPALLAITGVMPLDDGLREFMRPATFFVVTTYAISTALSNTTLSRRLLRRLLRLAGHDTGRIVLAIMIATCLLSSIVSNVPVTAIMMSAAMGILTRLRAVPGKSALGRVLMLGIPIAAMSGGIMTPAGSSVNVLALNVYREATGHGVSFLRWMAVGVPLAAALLPAGWFVLLRAFRPEPIPADVADALCNPDIPERLTHAERRTLVIIAGTVILWIAGSWVPAMDMTLVALLSLLAFFLPGMKVFTWEAFSRAISWDAVFTVGSVMVLGAAVVSTKLGAWIVDAVFLGAAAWPPIAFLIGTAFLLNLLHLALPVAPAIVAVTLPPLLLLAARCGVPGEAMAVLAPMMAGCVVLLPVDTMTVLTYEKGYYRIADMLRVGVVLGSVWAVAVGVGVWIWGGW